MIKLNINWVKNPKVFVRVFIITLNISPITLPVILTSVPPIHKVSIALQLSNDASILIIKVTSVNVSVQLLTRYVSHIKQLPGGNAQEQDIPLFE